MDRSEKRGLSKPAEKAKEPEKTEPAKEEDYYSKRPGDDYNPDMIKELVADMATRHTTERDQNYARHDKERSEMNKRHENDFKTLSKRHAEEISSTMNAPSTDNSAAAPKEE